MYFVPSVYCPNLPEKFSQPREHFFLDQPCKWVKTESDKLSTKLLSLPVRYEGERGVDGIAVLEPLPDPVRLQDPSRAQDVLRGVFG